MKYLSISLVSLFLAFATLASGTEVEEQIRDAIVQGQLDPESLNQLTDKQAFDTLKNSLYRYLRQSVLRRRHPEMVDRITEEIRKMPNHPALFSEWFEAIPNNPDAGRRFANAFMIAGAVKSEELVPLVASYLEDYKDYENLSIEDLKAGAGWGNNSTSSVRALGAMELPDAPVKGKNPITYTKADVQAWKAWWKNRQKDFKSKEIVKKPGLESQASAKILTASEPILAKKPPTPEKSPTETEVAEPVPENPFPYWIFIIGGVVVIGLVVVLKRK